MFEELAYVVMGWHRLVLTIKTMNETCFLAERNLRILGIKGCIWMLRSWQMLDALQKLMVKILRLMWTKRKVSNSFQFNTKHVQKVSVLNFCRLQKCLFELKYYLVTLVHMYAIFQHGHHSSQCSWYTRILIFWCLPQSSFLPTFSSNFPPPPSPPHQLKTFF